MPDDQSSPPALLGLKQPEAMLAPITVRIPKAVELLGISRTKLYELINAREIDVIKVGSSTLIVVASLHRFVENRRS